MTALTDHDVMLGPVPLAHSYGLSSVMNASMLAGARLELMPRFDTKAAWRLIRGRGVTVLTAVPTMYRRLANDPDADRNTDLRLAVVGGAACSRDLARDVWLRMGVHMVDRYGMTEASPLTWRVVAEDAPEGDVGRPGWGVHLRTVGKAGKVLPPEKAGEIEVRAPSMLIRYLRAEDNRDGFHDGWLRTGDIGVVRADGGLTLVARLKEVILRGGYSVAAGEVEAAIAAHPWVAEAVVIGVPDRDLGEELGAVLVLQTEGVTRPEAEVATELDQHIRERLASWKLPRLWRVVDHIPRTQLGKPKREELRRLFDEEISP
jgi:long-chain acyl-CoA synthetase